MTAAVEPFRIHVADAELADLRDRLARTRWPDPVRVAGWTRGVPDGYLRRLAAYWRTSYDWRSHEAALNELPQFTTRLDGGTIHFLHVRSPEPGALPLVLLHGWPSSFVEFLRVVGPLAEPRSHAADPADAFHVVVPSLPGFGFSRPGPEPGWGDLFRVAQVIAELMNRLGYHRYFVAGGDVGACVAGVLAAIDPEQVAGTYVTGPAPYPFGPPLDVQGLNGMDLERAERFNRYRADGLGYLHLQSTRPQTIAYALTDSPVAQLAWIVEKFQEWTDPHAELPEAAVDLDQLLTNISLYWFTRSGASSAHFTCEGMQSFRAYVEQGGQRGRTAAPSAPPLGVAVFAADSSVRAVLDPGNAVRHWREFDCGGHFPAMEAPEILADDMRAFFRSCR